MAGILYVDEGYWAETPTEYAQTGLSVDWEQKIVFVPQIFMTLIQSVPSIIYELDLNLFRLAIADIQDDAVGMPFDTIISHSPPVDIGGVTLARVVELINGYTVTFENKQYAVNLTGANTNLGDLVNVNLVSVRTSNSAGLVTSAAIEFGEYGGGVHIDETLPTSGTAYPIGTLRSPVGNLTDALQIATSRGFDKIFAVGNLTLDTGDWTQGFKFYGQSPAVSTITIDPGAIMDNCEILDAYITGTLDTNNIVRECIVGPLTSLDGYISRSAIVGPIALGGNLQTTLLECFSNVAGGAATPIISIGTGSALAVRAYSGGLELQDKTGTDPCSVDVNSGQIVVDSTCVAGTITLRGVGKVTDNSGVGCTVIDEMINAANTSNAVWTTATADYTDTDTMGGFMAEAVLTVQKFLGLK